MAKTAIDVELLLRWAYREELVKCTTSSAEGLWEDIRDYAFLGGVDTDGAGAQRYDLGLPDTDAVWIERAVGSLQDLIVDWEASRHAVMGDLAELLTTRDRLMLRPLKTAALVTMHARMGTRPNWRDRVPQPYPVPAAKGAVGRAAIVGECRGKNLYTTGSHCPLRWEPSPVVFALARAEYAAWHRGLCTLAETLVLDRHVALPPRAPAQPWSEREPEAQVLAVGERPRTRLPLRPPRERMGPAVRRPRASPVRSVPLDKGAKA
ncbi:MAG: hypothetical protein IT481_08475 [Gammaproteobacteria bacterium]|nr:hypothetical protein [Gammaproteobacteria bacterium]